MTARYFIEDGAIWSRLSGMEKPVLIVTTIQCVKGFRWYCGLNGRSGYRSSFPSDVAALRAAAKTLGITVSEAVA
jgi:hypothetical protein